MNKSSLKLKETAAIPSPLVMALIEAFERAADPEIAVGQAAYMRNKFEFLGLKSPVRDEIQRPLFRQYPVSDVEELSQILLTLWNCEYREYHHAACDFAIHSHRHFTPSLLKTCETLIRTHSWWDSVDTLATRIVGPIVQKHPELLPQMDQWIEDPYPWIRRTALLYQLKYKKETDTDRLFDYCARRLDESDFFIRKAIGWALREYAKTAPENVIAFVARYHRQMAPLSVREALKHFPEERKRFIP